MGNQEYSVITGVCGDCSLDYSH